MPYSLGLKETNTIIHKEKLYMLLTDSIQGPLHVKRILISSLNMATLFIANHYDMIVLRLLYRRVPSRPNLTK